MDTKSLRMDGKNVDCSLTLLTTVLTRYKQTEAEDTTRENSN